MTTRKFTLEMGTRLAEMIDYLAYDESITKGELIRRALALLKVALDETKQGKKLVILDSDGRVEKELVLT